MQAKIARRLTKDSVLGGIIAAPIGIATAIGAFTMGGNDFDLIYLQQRGQKVSEAIEYNINVMVQGENLNNGDSGDAGEGTGDNTVITNTATTGEGLNLLLINNIQTECFVKEYLTIAAENQNGELDTTNRQKCASVQMIIGVNTSESGFYSAGGGDVLPKTDLPAGADGAPIWDNNVHSLKNWSVNEHSSGGATATGGPFQYVSGGSITAINTESKYNKGTSTGSGVGDCYLFPDAAAGLNGYLEMAISWAGGDISSLSDNAASMSGVIAHNRGAGGLNMIFGIPYDTILNRREAGNYLGDKSISEISECLETIYSDITTIPSGVDVEGIARSSGDACTLFSSIANGWMFSEAAAANVKHWYSDATKSYWNQLFPSEQVSNAQEFNEAVSRHTSKLSTALGISDSECDAIYGTINGDYKTYSGNAPRGDIFKVTNKTSNVYKNAPGAKLVLSMEAMCAGHVFKTFVIAGRTYAKMLKYAGVDVDPTNPATYMGGYSDAGEWTPTGDSAETTLVSNGLDMDAVTTERMKVLKAAAGLVGIKYIQCRHSASCDGCCFDNMSTRPTHLDCSSFVWRAYAEAGCNMSGFPQNTGSYQSSSAMVSISINELKPGDLVVRRSGSSGHVEIFLGNNNGVFSFVEAFRSGKDSGFCKKNMSAVQGSTYHYYRFTGFNE